MTKPTMYRIIGGLLLLAAFLLMLSLLLFPRYFPEQTISLGERIERAVARVTLPLKVARLATQPADRELLMPVNGVSVSQITDTWHAPRPNGRLHEGQDIFASRGTPIFSATPGYVMRITDDTIGGNSVSVIGSGGRYYYYTHLDRYAEDLRVGQEVTTDTLLGTVGNTGNAATTPPHLHFGAYTLDGEAFNPLPLLVDRE